MLFYNAIQQKQVIYSSIEHVDRLRDWSCMLYIHLFSWKYSHIQYGFLNREITLHMLHAVLLRSKIAHTCCLEETNFERTYMCF